MVTWRVDFAPVREAEPVAVPPQPEETGTEEEQAVSEPESDGAENKEAVSSDGAVRTGGSESSEGIISSRQSTGQVQPSPTPQNPVSAADFSGLKRTLFSCGLLLALAAAAYLISKYKQTKGGNST